MLLVTIDYNFKHVATYTCPVIPLNNLYLIVKTKMKLLNISLSLRRQFRVTNVSPVLMDTHSVNTYCTVKQTRSYLVVTKPWEFSCLIYVICVFFAHSGVQHILCCVFLRLVYTMLPVSLDCPFLIALRYSLTFT